MYANAQQRQWLQHHRRNQEPLRRKTTQTHTEGKRCVQQKQRGADEDGSIYDNGGPHPQKRPLLNLKQFNGTTGSNTSGIKKFCQKALHENTNSAIKTDIL
jgi:hypothetical protein